MVEFGVGVAVGVLGSGSLQVFYAKVVKPFLTKEATKVAVDLGVPVSPAPTATAAAPTTAAKS